MTAVRIPLPHWRTQSRPCRHSRPTPAIYGPAYLATYPRFPNKRLIAVRKLEHSVKDHLSMFLLLEFRVLRRNRNSTFLRAFVNILQFLGRGSMSENVLHTDYGWSGVRCPCWWLTGQAGPPPPLRDRPHPTDRGPRRRGAGLAVYCTVSGNVSECRDPVRDEKRPTFYMFMCPYCALRVLKSSYYWCAFGTMSSFEKKTEVEVRSLNPRTRVVKKTNFGNVCGLMDYVVRKSFLSSMISFVAKNIDP